MWCAAALAAPKWTVNVVDQHGQPVSNALVMLSDGTVMPPDAANREVGQRNAEFDPRVSVVSRGTAVQFPNRDRARHHVYSFSSART
ncbi:MAG: methylamine utilization protein, partial [Pseudomonadota bacterium]